MEDDATMLLFTLFEAIFVMEIFIGSWVIYWFGRTWPLWDKIHILNVTMFCVGCLFLIQMLRSLYKSTRKINCEYENVKVN